MNSVNSSIICSIISFKYEVRDSGSHGRVQLTRSPKAGREWPGRPGFLVAFRAFAKLHEGLSQSPSRGDDRGISGHLRRDRTGDSRAVGKNHDRWLPL